jgi:23S rRNA pseudouridine2605 synthase
MATKSAKTTKAPKTASPAKARKTKKTADPKPPTPEPEPIAAPEAELPALAAEESVTEPAVIAELQIEPETAPQIEAAEIEALTEAELEGAAYIASVPEDLAESQEEEDEPEFEPKPRPPAKLERLQKILAQAGVASRRRAEELITQGRIQVNGKVVSELGSKADAGRDHIRVDGKLLQGAERLRYFVLNKPRGFVTTVKDPEGRATVMQFFDKFRERLYPVGRLDYLSEGLLLVTNDGDLANRLTRAASGVEKTYLVKVSGQPTEGELNILRGGVAIERGKPGSPQVRTSPARIRQVRQGDNPWYEVILIEGRNRELRKMFEEIGHFVEKIRRVGYGPLVLDQEPGNLRELQPEEVEALRKAAEGKLRTPKSKEIRRRNAADAAQLPTVTARPSRPRPIGSVPTRSGPARFGPASSGEARPIGPRTARPAEARPAEDSPREYPARKSFGPGSSSPARDSARPFRPAADRSETGPRRTGAGPARFGPPRPSSRVPERTGARPAWKKEDRPTRPPARFAAGATGEGRPAGRGFPAKPAWKKPERPDRPVRPDFKRPAAPRPEAPEPESFSTPPRPSRLQIDPVHPESERASRPGFSRPGDARSSEGRPPRSGGNLPRPFTTSSGKPRPGGARPSSKPDRPGGRSYGSSSSAGPGKRTFRPTDGPGDEGPRDESRSSFTPRPARASGSRPPRPFTPRAEGTSESRPPGRYAGPPSGRSTDSGSSAPRGEGRSTGGWKPKPSFGGKSRPGGGSQSRPPSNSGPRGFGPKPSGPRPGGKRSGPPSGKPTGRPSGKRP